MAPRQPAFKPTIWSKDNILVPISIVVSALIGTVGITSVVMSKLYEIQGEIRSVRHMSEQCWTRPQAREQHNQQWRDNPTLNWEKSQPDVIAARVQ